MAKYQPEKVFLGIDVGGTDVKLGLIDQGGNILTQSRTATSELVTPDRVFQHALQQAGVFLSELSLPNESLAGVGVAVPGVLDSRKFILREVVNLPGWLEVPLMDELKKQSSLPSSIVNDANAAAFAEHAIRSLEDKSLALVTLGTGVGCGVVFRGQPHGGDHGCAGELGHIAIDFGDSAIPCTCGSRGHLESYAGAGGVVARLKSAIADEPQSSVPDVLRSHQVSPLDVSEQAAAGNRICMKVIVDTGMYVGRAIGMIGQVADPDVVLLGGAMTFGGSGTMTGDSFIKSVRDSVKATTLVQVGGNITIDFATLGNNAGIIGAGLLAKNQSID